MLAEFYAVANGGDTTAAIKSSPSQTADNTNSVAYSLGSLRTITRDLILVIHLRQN